MKLSEELANEAMQQALDMLRKIEPETTLDDRVKVITAAKQLLDKLERETVQCSMLGEPQ